MQSIIDKKARNDSETDKDKDNSVVMVRNRFFSAEEDGLMMDSGKDLPSIDRINISSHLSNDKGRPNSRINLFR